MHRIWIAVLLLSAGCEEIDPSGDVLSPVAVSASGSSTTESEPTGPQGDFDFESQDRESEDAEVADRDAGVDDLYAGFGIERGPEEPDREPEPDPPPAPTVDVPAIVPATAVLQPWQPGVAIEGSWGVRLVSTVVDAQPPRAILGMPDGSEEVVQPGSLLPSVGVVVLAIGRDAVQIAEIVPDGDRARVSNQTLTALYPGTPAPR